MRIKLPDRRALSIWIRIHRTFQTNYNSQTRRMLTSKPIRSIMKSRPFSWTRSMRNRLRIVVRQARCLKNLTQALKMRLLLTTINLLSIKIRNSPRLSKSHLKETYWKILMKIGLHHFKMIIQRTCHSKSSYLWKKPTKTIKTSIYKIWSLFKSKKMMMRFFKRAETSLDKSKVFKEIKACLISNHK